MDVRAAIKERVEARTAGKPFDFRALLDVIAEVLKDGRVTQADYPAVADYAEELFEEYVRPYDIPGVGPVVERFVDDALKRMIRPALKILFDRFVGQEGPDVKV